MLDFKLLADVQQQNIKSESESMKLVLVVYRLTSQCCFGDCVGSLESACTGSVTPTGAQAKTELGPVMVLPAEPLLSQ